MNATRRRHVVRACRSWEELAARADALEALTPRALERSPSAEAWMLVPALRYLREDREVLVALVGDAADGADARVDGVFPLEIKRRYRELPLTVLSLWNHDYALLAAPLVDAAQVGPVLEALLDWIGRNWPPGTLLEFPALIAESRFCSALEGALAARPGAMTTADLWTRALFRPAADAEQYLASAFNHYHRKRYRRGERRLADLGALTYDEWSPGTPVEPWIREFAALEMGGWKGREGTAFGCRPGHVAWLEAVAAAAAARGRLMVLALRIGGRAAAMRISFVDGPGSYAFKSAYDEAYARDSPGVLIEIETVRRLHARPELRWMDSLATAENPMINRVWPDRVAVSTLLVAPDRALARAAVRAFPMLRAIRQRLRGSPPPSTEA